MALGKLPVPGRPTIWMIVGQGPIALAVGAGVGCLNIFTLLYLFSPLSPSLWETARYRLKYCLKPKTTSQPTKSFKLRNSNRIWTNIIWCRREERGTDVQELHIESPFTNFI